MGKTKVIIRVLGVLLLLVGFYYLFFYTPPITTSGCGVLGLKYYQYILLGGFLVVLGSILSLNGKRLMKGIFAKGWKKKVWGYSLFLLILTFTLLYMWFNSGFELLAGDVNNTKIVMFKVASIGLSLAVLIGVIPAKKIFELKSTRY